MFDEQIVSFLYALRICAERCEQVESKVERRKAQRSERSQ